MTLILGQASHQFVLQVSDRLVTQDGKPFDQISNKTILYVAPDAVISMAYTGLAYLDGIPTDQWLANIIHGRPLPPGPHATIPTALSLGRTAQWLHIGPTLELIRERLTIAFASSKLRRKASKPMFEILITGWQWGRRKRARPMIAGIVKERGLSVARIWRSPRHIGRRYSFAGTPETNLKSSDLESLETSLGKIRSADEAEDILVGTIRTVSRRSRLVGADCMSVLIPSPRLCNVRVRYIPQKIRSFVVVSGSPRQSCGTFPSTFSPWILGPGLMQAPCVFVNPMTLGVGSFKIELDGPQLNINVARGHGGRRLLFAMGAVKRPREPQ